MFSFYGFGRFISYVYFRLGWRVEIRGRHHIPARGAVIVAANHRSYADPPLVGVGMTRPLHFLAKQELFSFAPFGWLISNLNAHPLNRVSSTGALKTALALLKEGEAVIIFPEGTRQKTDQFGAAKAGVGLLALKSGAPVLPVFIENSGHMPSFKKLRVTFGPLIPSLHEKDAQLFSEKVMSAIRQLKG